MPQLAQEDIDKTRSFTSTEEVFRFCFLLSLDLLPWRRLEEDVLQQPRSGGSVVRVRCETVHDEDLRHVRHTLWNLGVDLKHAHLEDIFFQLVRI